MDKLPTINSGVTSNVSKEFDKADAQLAKARKKRKARKKIKPEHIQKVKQGKTQSVSGTQQGVKASQDAQGKYDGSSGERNAAKANQSYDPQVRQAMTQAVQSGSNNFSPPSVNVTKVSGLNGIKDVNQLSGMFDSQQSQRGGLASAMQTIGRAQTGQLQQNRGFAQSFKQFQGLAKSFDVKEKLYNGKAKTFNSLSQTLSGVANGVTAAATALTTAATAVQSAAAACAAIPYVGPALSAVLKAVAAMLKGIAQALKGVAKMMQTMSKKMGALGKKMQGIGQKMKVSKLANKAKEIASKTKLDQGVKKLQQIQQARARVQQSIGINQQNLNGIAQRMQALGRRAPGQGSGAGIGNAAPTQQQNPMGNNLMAAGAAALAAGAMAALAGQGKEPSQAPAASAGTPFSGPTASPAVSTASFGGGASFGSGANFGGGSSGGRGFVPAPSSPPPVLTGEPPHSTMPALPIRSFRPTLEAKDKKDPAGKTKIESPSNKKKAARGDLARGQMAGPRQLASAGKSQAAGDENASDVRRDYEAKLKELTQQVVAAQGGAEVSQRQSQLAQLYNKVAEEGVEIGDQVERSASQALEGSEHRPNKKITTARGNTSVKNRAGQQEGQGLAGGSSAQSLLGQNRVGVQQAPVQPQMPSAEVAPQPSPLEDEHGGFQL